MAEEPVIFSGLTSHDNKYTTAVYHAVCHGGTSAIYIFMAQLALFNEGYETIFQYV